MSSKTKDFLAQYYGEAAQPATDFESKPKRKKAAKAPIKPLQGFKIIDEQAQNEDYEDFSSPIPSKKTDIVIDFSAETKKKELEQIQRTSLREPADSSPPRRPRLPRTHPEYGSPSPPRRVNVNPIDDRPDISPPRRRNEDANTLDFSPPRRTRTEQADLSPPRRGSVDDVDLSPPRKQRVDEGGIPDLSLFRRQGNTLDLKHEPDIDRGALGITMLNGERAGLQTGAEITAEARRKREQEIARLAAKPTQEAVDEEPVQTVYRDQFGRKIDPNTQMEKMTETRRAEDNRHLHRSSSARYDDVDPEESRREYRGKRAEDQEVTARQVSRQRWDDPLARLKESGVMGSDDDELDEYEFHRHRTGGGDFEDPMSKFADSKRKKKRKREDDAKSRTAKSKFWSGWFPPNRYNVRPGIQWDGVDRSNGFEAKLFQAQLDRQHRAEQAYRYTSSEM